MMGLAMNALPLRIAIPPRAPVLTWLKQLRADWKAAGAHARTPLPQIREWCELPRHVAPFETLMSFEFGQLDNRIRSLPGDWSRRRFKVSRRSSVPITFLAYDEARLKLAIEFHKQALDQATAERMLRELRRWLEAVCDDPTLATDRLAALAPQEAFAPIESEAPLEPATLDGGSVVSAFRAQATARPEAPAIGGERTLSYGALDERSERIARALMARGVGRGTVVGVYGERTADAIAGILGVLKAGAAYLPLDPTYPDDRLAFMAAHSGTRVILGDETARARLASPGLEVIDLAAAQAADRGPTPGPLAEPGAEDPAYVIYTSGSTGRPKGVVVRHRNLAYSTAARLSYYREPVDSFLLLSSLSFDSSVAGIFWTLCSGGRLVLPPSGAEREPPELAAIVQKERVTHLLGLASLYGLVLETGAAALQSLRVCVVAGEPCPPTLVAEHLAALPGARLYNEYGPTEASVWCTVHRADHAPSGPRTPIGAPIPGARIYIVADGRLAPVGTPGEIFVGGPGVAQGYLNSPELTERSFVADSFGGRPGERLYRTGDLARLLPDGSIDLLGRVDHQVKIRGHRIELEEVEAALSGLPAVRAAAVAVLEATPGAKQLTAFLVFREGPRPTEAGVREMLRGRLPAFMIPAAFLAVDALPTGANGKLDREALSRVAGAPLQRAVHVAPATPAQRELASLWCELLALKGVGVHDDFFALGGDSLSAVRLVNQINAHCGVRLRVADLYEHPTIEGLARLVETVPETGRGTAAIVTLKAGDGPLPLYIFHTGPKEVRFAQLIDRRPIYSIEQPWPDAWLRGSEPGAARSIPSAEEIVAPLVDLVLEHTRGRPFALAGHSTKGLLAFELARQVRARGGRPELMVLFDTWRDHPTRLRVALHRWRRALKTRDDAGRVWESGAAVLRAAARQLARKARNALWPWLGLHVPKGGEYELTSVFNQDGVLQRWSRVEPVYAKVAATYRPQPQPMAGILFTAAKATDFDARAIDATMGWGGLFERGLDLVPVPADHDFTIGPDDPALARAMNAGLGRRWPRLAASANQRVEVAPGLA
jgi:amino acid adenylation domain-containing protein